VYKSWALLMTHLKDDRGYSSLIESVYSDDLIKWD
jgi:hypothetical protein